MNGQVPKLFGLKAPLLETEPWRPHRERIQQQQLQQRQSQQQQRQCQQQGEGPPTYPDPVEPLSDT